MLDCLGVLFQARWQHTRAPDKCFARVLHFVSIVLNYVRQRLSFPLLRHLPRVCRNDALAEQHILPQYLKAAR